MKTLTEKLRSGEFLFFLVVRESSGGGEQNETKNHEKN